MSFLDFFGGGGGDGSDATGGAGASPFGGGGFDLSSIMGGDSGGGLGSLLGGLGMGGYNPSQDLSQNTPTPQQTNQANDPGGQLAGSRDTTDQGRDTPPGKSNQSSPLGDIAKIFASLGGQGQQQGQQGQQGQGPGWITPNTPTMQPGDYTRTQPPVPLGQQPGQQPQPPAQPPSGPQSPGPNQSQAAVAKGQEAGGVPGQAKQPAPTPTPAAKPAADLPKTPNVEAHPGAPAAPTGGQQPGGGQMASPLQAIVGMLLQSLLGRIGGPYGAMLGQLMRPMLQQLAGQAGFGTGMRGPFPDYGGRMPANLPPNAGGGLPTAGPGSPHGPAAPGAQPAANQNWPAGRGNSRAERNNNPGNLEASPWTQKLPGYMGSDGRFARFRTPQDGQNAMIHLLQNKMNRGDNTVAKIIHTWSPDSDRTNRPGQEAAYAGRVARQMGIGPNDPITPQDLPRMAQIMSGVESGHPTNYQWSGAGAQQPQPGYGLYTPNQWRPSDREIMQRRLRRRMSGWAF